MKFEAESPKRILKEIAPSPMTYSNGEESVIGWNSSVKDFLQLNFSTLEPPECVPGWHWGI